MASFVGPSMTPDSVFTTGPIENQELENNTETMDTAPTDEPQPEQLKRIFNG
jgi:hypothetical protein